MEHHPKPPQNDVLGGKESLKKFLKDIDRTVEPYPRIDVHEELSRSRETPKGHATKVATYTAAALLVGIALYGFITHDRELLLTLGYSAIVVLAWVLGKKVPGRLPGSRKYDDTDEEDN